MRTTKSRPRPRLRGPEQPPHDGALKDKYLIKHVEGSKLPVLVIRKDNVTQAIGDKLKDASFERFIL